MNNPKKTKKPVTLFTVTDHVGTSLSVFCQKNGRIVEMWLEGPEDAVLGVTLTRESFDQMVDKINKGFNGEGPDIDPDLIEPNAISPNKLEEKFEPGDTVRLKGGGTYDTFTVIPKIGAYIGAKDWVPVMWLDKNRILQKADIPAVALEKIEDKRKKRTYGQ